jgi:hypothetical protein
MPPRRANIQARTDAVPTGQKRPAEDVADAPPTKKARQNASSAAAPTVASAESEVIVISSDEGSDTGESRSPKKATVVDNNEEDR